MKYSSPNDVKNEESRRRELFEAAIGVFTRYGYRKTSMEQVARAAGISRQGLYLHFVNKEALFRATVSHVMKTSLRAAETVLGNEALPLDRRLVRAFDEWVGKYAGMAGAESWDLIQAAHLLVGDLKTEYESRFAEAVAGVLRGSALAEAYAPAGVTPAQLTALLTAAAGGLKCRCASREAFGRDFTETVKVVFVTQVNTSPPVRKRLRRAEKAPA